MPALESLVRQPGILSYLARQWVGSMIPAILPPVILLYETLFPFWAVKENSQAGATAAPWSNPVAEGHFAS